MANVTLFDQTGKEAGQVVLNDAVFGIEPNAVSYTHLTLPTNREV